VKSLHLFGEVIQILCDVVVFLDEELYRGFIFSNIWAADQLDCVNNVSVSVVTVGEELKPKLMRS